MSGRESSVHDGASSPTTEFQRVEGKATKPATTYRPSSSNNGDVDHGKRQHELQLNFKVKITNKSTQKHVKLDPTTLQDKIVLNDDSQPEDKAKYYEQASVSELKDLLKERGLPATGKKPALVERLLSPTNKQRITPLHISDNRPPSPNGSPKLKGGSAQSPRYSPYSGSSSPRLQELLSPRLVSNLSLNSPLEEDSVSFLPLFFFFFLFDFFILFILFLLKLLSLFIGNRTLRVQPAPVVLSRILLLLPWATVVLTILIQALLLRSGPGRSRLNLDSQKTTHGGFPQTQTTS